MKNQTLKTGLLSLIVAGVATILPTQAALYITGEIGFIGSATLNAPISSATQFNSISAWIGGVSSIGSYSTVPTGTSVPVTFTPFAFNVSPGAPFQLWAFSYNGADYSFDVTSVQVTFQQGKFLNVEGTGVAKITGYDDTLATWSIADTGTGSTVTFASVAVIPEPTTSVMILGFGTLFLLFRHNARK